MNEFIDRYKVFIGLTILTLLLSVIMFFGGYSLGHRVGFMKGYDTGVEETKCDGGTHVPNVWQK